MDLRDSPEQARFRTAARTWLAENVPAAGAGSGPPGPGEEEVAAARAWQRRLHRGGWAGLDWPREHGGRGAGPVECLIWDEEQARAWAPNRIVLAVGLDLTGPVLIAHGTPAQKARYLEPILRGDELWCQGFSEPGAGSDLAALRTRGEVRGDEIVVTGQKIWTSFARHADHCILVVRTDPASTRHRGLTFLLCDMRTPGIQIRPLREMTGHAWFNEVFFDGVRVPRENVVGEIGRGWDVVMTTLSVERGSSAPHARLEAELERLVALARGLRRDGGRALDDPRLRDRLVHLASGIRMLRITAYRAASAAQGGGTPGPDGSTLKLLWSELDQRLKETAAELLGPAGLVPAGDPLAVDEGYWAYALLWSRAATLYAGTSEIQRNLLAQRVLGLPRDR